MARTSRAVHRKPEGPSGLLEMCRTVPARRFARPAECCPGGSEEPPGRPLRRRAARPDVPTPRTVPATPPTRMADVSPGRLVVLPNDVAGADDVPSSRAAKDRSVSVAGDAATLQPGEPTCRPVRRAPPLTADRRPNGRLAALRVSSPEIRDRFGSALPADFGPRRRGGLAFRGLSHVRVRAASHPVLPERLEPILSWVFTSLGFSPLLPWPCRFARPPLSHLDLAGAETATRPVPQSVSEQEDWLASLEAADPFEVPVLVFVRQNGRGRPTRTGLGSDDPASGNPSEDETGSRRRRPSRSVSSPACRTEAPHARPATGAA